MNGKVPVFISMFPWKKGLLVVNVDVGGSAALESW